MQDWSIAIVIDIGEGGTNNCMRKKKQDKKLKITKIRTSSMPEEEKKKLLFEAFDLILSQKDPSKK